MDYKTLRGVLWTLCQHITPLNSKQAKTFTFELLQQKKRTLKELMLL